MSKQEEKIELYRKSLEEKCGITADMALLTAIVKSLGPSIYNADAEIVAASEKDEVKTLKENFIMKKLGIEEQGEVDSAFDAVVEKYGKSNPRKYRAVLCYLLVEHFGKQDMYK